MHFFYEFFNKNANTYSGGIMLRLILCITILLFASCDTMYKESVNVSTDNGITYYMYIDENNSVKKVYDSVDISISKNRLTPILAYSSEVDENPLGCIYPYSSTPDVYGGFSAWILYKLLRCSKEEPEKVHQYLSHFNWQRFSELIEKYELCYEIII